jgi:nicotinic acid phosphoribosyltransferase
MEGITTLSNDKYSYTTSYAIFQQNRHNLIGTNEIFYRKPPCSKYPYVILGGTHFALEYLQSLNFSNKDLEIIEEVLQINSNNQKSAQSSSN